MQNKLNILTIAFAVLAAIAGTTRAQEVLTLEQAVTEAVENNYSISIARNNAEIADNNVSAGNAGFLPKVDLNGQIRRSVSDTQQEFISGQANDRDGAVSDAYSAGVALDWTLFDGLAMFVSLDMLKGNRRAAELQLKAEIENLVAELTDYYFRIVRQNYLIKVTEESIALSEERLRIVNDKYELGSASKLELLQAQVDLNTDRSSLLTEKASLKNMKVKFNRMLGRDIDTPFEISDTILVDSALDFAALKDGALTQNSSLQLASVNLEMAELSVQTYRAKLFPELSFFASYDYSHSESESGFLLTNTLQGYTYGLRLSYNLFDGFNKYRNIENASIDKMSGELELLDMKLFILASLRQTFNNYEKNLELVSFEENNLEVARETLDIAFDRLRLGAYSPLELREAQRNYVLAQSRLISAMYAARINENDLMKISGRLFR